MKLKIEVFTNCDDTLIVWQPDERIPDCRGFALYRRRVAADGSETEETISTWVGWENEDWLPGTRKFSTEWPIQRFIWTDYQAQNGDKLRYRVVPMCGRKGQLKPRNDLQATSKTVVVGTGQTPGFHAYFNRGIVASQWLTRRLGSIPPKEQRKKLADLITDPASQIRQFLAGEVRVKMLALMEEARKSKGLVYASLYEFNDPELLAGLESIGKNAHVILCNGSPKPDKPDQNATERRRLKQRGKFTIYDRIVKSPHLSHHKFMVLCDQNGNAKKVWTGSTNWTVTGLCTQANNGILIEDTTVATWFKEQWERLRDAGDEYPASLKQEDSKVRQTKVGSKATETSVWFAPTSKEVDMEQARALVRQAKQGVLFLFFNPGPQNTLLNEVVDSRDKGLFIHGVANQDPGGDKKPVLYLYDRGTQIKPSLDVLLPEAINETFKGWEPELRNYSIAMIHSKVVVVDPFGDYPVVMTGSHNLGPKASRSNDDNLLIIENAPGLAAEYAVNILAIYGQYKWRHTQADPKTKDRWKGLQDNDQWQDGMMKGPRWDEVSFWLGQYRKKK